MLIGKRCREFIGLGSQGRLDVKERLQDTHSFPRLDGNV